jgi:hypothetical protein
MKKPPDHPLRASDVLNWNYLVEIGEKPEGIAKKDLALGLKEFAYDFTSTASEDVRDQLLQDIIKNSTYNQSRETAEDVIRVLASRLQSDRNTLRKFARQIGVRLSPDWILARRDPTFSDP